MPRRLLGPLLEVDRLESIHLGTTSPACWPQRFPADLRPAFAGRFPHRAP
ncbi:hypothetical protein [Streptosporangium sp. OZ121]